MPLPIMPISLSPPVAPFSLFEHHVKGTLSAPAGLRDPFDGSEKDWAWAVRRSDLPISTGIIDQHDGFVRRTAASDPQHTLFRCGAAILLEHLDAGAVAVRDVIIEESVVEQVEQRLKHLASIDQSMRQLRPWEDQTGSGSHLFLTVQWQAVEVLADHHVCQQPGTRPAAGNRLGWHGRGADALFTRTGIDRANVPDNLALLRDNRERFEHLLADTLQRFAVVTLLHAGLEVIDNVYSRQVRRQCLVGLLAPTLVRGHRDRFVFVISRRRRLCQQLSFIEQLKLIRDSFGAPAKVVR